MPRNGWHPARGAPWNDVGRDDRRSVQKGIERAGPGLDGSAPQGYRSREQDAGGPGGRGPGPDPGDSVWFVRCPVCSGLEDKVVDSRVTDDGTAIRRRRECAGCGARFTTFERLEEQAFTVVKRSGDRVPFDRVKVEEGVAAAAKGRPVTVEQMQVLSLEVEEELRLAGPEVPSEAIGLAVLERLRVLDEVAYLRFASVYKDFSEASDFERELQVLTKQTEPKRH